MTGCRPLAWLVLFLAMATGAELQAQTAIWRTEYAVARQEALSSGRPLILHFTTANCLWCQRLEQTTYRNPGIDRALAERFVPLKVDAEQYPSLVEYLKVDSFPTIVVAAADGRVLERHKGYLAPAPFAEFLSRGLAKL